MCEIRIRISALMIITYRWVLLIDRLQSGYTSNNSNVERVLSLQTRGTDNKVRGGSTCNLARDSVNATCSIDTVLWLVLI